MRDKSAGTTLRIFTIGHSNHEPEAFAALLEQHGVQVVADVRSQPYSAYAQHFSKGHIEGLLRAHGIKYLFLGDVLGGRPEGDEFYDDAQRVLYDRVAGSEPFRQGIERLLDGIRAYTVALLCGEEDPAECHRRLLVGRVLRERGVEVLHIRGDGRVESEHDVCRDEESRRTGGQMQLFDTGEAEAWRSTRSVSPRKAPPSSSTP
ncbi:MAG: DUF488 domain-containing protein [Verrucomicrobia bacterium]|nr:DUF488 domain-containing protein [Verrucomicrobiota bacterium]